ncbi:MULTISPECIES: phage tail tape measure protein [Streptomyces]|uniref:phage tail tape measure protein n=1 Tax=Streptomyces TaxID=1883 RepID=UPI0016039183|nr:phage tail tape measure protein [Streptomyces murinus]MBA9050786.1 SLT domain-containing protein/phage-related minor tail protein [Streptomyces murinus]
MPAPEIAVAYVSIVPEIQGFAAQLRSQIVGPAGDAGDQAGEAASSGLKDKLVKGAAAVGVAAGALLAKGISDAIAQADVKRKLQAQLGATPKEADKYGKVAGKLYAQGVSGSFEDAADAIKSVMQSGIAPPKATNAQLQAIATKASDVANVFDQDLGGVTNAVSQMLRTGMAKNADQAFDVLTKGFQNGANKADDLLDTFNEYGTQFRKLGLDGPKALGLISQGVKAGARDADVAADALKEFSIRAIDGSDTTAQGFKALGLNAKTMGAQIAKGGKSASDGLTLTLAKLRGIKDPVKQSAAATALFGTQAEDLGKALFAMDPSKATKDLGKFGGSAKGLGDTIRSGPIYQLQTFKRTAQQDLVEVLGKYVVPTLLTVKRYGTEAFGWVKDNQAWLLPFAAGIAAIATAVGIYNGVTKTIALVTRGWAIAQGILNTVMALNPFVLVALAVIGLGAALVVAYKKSATFRAIVQAAFKGVQDVVGAVVDWFTGSFIPFFTKTIPGAFSAVVNWVKKNWPWILGALTGPIGLAVVYIVKHWKQISDAFGAGWGWIKKNVLYPIRDFFTKMIPGWAGTLRDKVSGAFSDAAKMAGKGWSKLQDLAKAPVRFVVETVYNRGIVGMWNKIAGAFGAPKLGEWHPKGFAAGGYTGAGGKFTPAGIVHRGEYVIPKDATSKIGLGNLEYMRKHGKLPGYSLGGLVGGAWDWTKDAVSGAGSAAWDKIKKTTSWISDTMEASARAGVTHVVEPLLSQIPGTNAGFGKAIKGIPMKAVDAIFGYSKIADSKLGAQFAKYAGGGTLGKWIAKAMQWTKVPGSWAGPLRTLVMRESGGNPNAVNNWDSNAKAGHPSKGLAQTIDSTFQAFRDKHLPNNIFDPVANLVAAIRYIKARYGSIFNVQQAVGKTPKGYAKGGYPRAGETAWVGENGPELVTFGRSATVYPHDVSMRMAGSLGGLRGFAKGTPNASKRAKDIQKVLDDLLTTFRKKMVGTAKDISSATASMIKQVKALRRNGDISAKAAAKATSVIAKLSKEQTARANKLASVRATIAEAKKYAADTKASILDSGSLGNLGATNIRDAITGMRSKASDASKFADNLKKAQKLGVSKDLLKQLADMGPDQGGALAESIANAVPEDVAQLNSAYKSLSKTATSFGNSMADTLYDSGKNAGKGFLAGLKSQEKELTNVMARAVKDAINQIGKAVGGKKYKPTHDSGGFLQPGATMAVNATGKPEPVLTHSQWSNIATLAANGGSGGFQPGDRLLLSIDGRTTLEAYVDRRADDRIQTGLSGPAALGRSI